MTATGIIFRCVAALSLSLLCCSCRHDELCYHHPHTVPVRIDVDWSYFSRYETPTGMTVILFPEDGSGPYRTMTNTIDHAVMSLPAGIYHTLVFNQSETEFGTVTFRDMNSPQTAVVAVERAPRWYTRGPEPVATEPEWLGVGNDSHTVVTPDMVEDVVHSSPMMRRDAEPLVAKIVPHNIVQTVYVIVHVKGIQNLRSARAALTGMSEGYLLAKDKHLDSTVTYLLENFKVTLDESDYTCGYIEASIHCFGLPESHADMPDENELSLEMLLVDNKTIVSYDFLVGDRFVKVDHNGAAGVADDELEAEVNLEIAVEIEVDAQGNPIVLPDVEPAGGSSGGFDAEVEDWGEPIIQDIPV